jgi:GntR family transcriptional regulator
MSFHDQVRSWGRRPSSRLVEGEVRPATAAEAAALQLTAVSRQVVAITRVRLADDVPLAVEYACFPPHLDGLLEADLETGSLHRALHERGVRPTLGSSTLTAQPAGRDGGRLQVPAGRSRCAYARPR